MRITASASPISGWVRWQWGSNSTPITALSPTTPRTWRTRSASQSSQSVDTMATTQEEQHNVERPLRPHGLSVDLVAQAS